MIKVRNAEVRDTPKLIEMGRLMHGESPRYKGSDFCDEKVNELIQNMINLEQGFIVVAEDVQDKEKGPVIIGMMLGFITEEYFGKSLSACDLLVYVDHEFRASKAAILMIRGYESWANAQGVRTIQLGISAGINVEQTKSFYNKMGFQDAGYITLKGL